jgi:hypothetical protein
LFIKYSQFSEHLAGDFEHRFAVLGQLHVAAVANEQRRTVVTLQLLNLPAHRALRQMQLVCHFVEAGRFRHECECLKGLERRWTIEFIHAFF